MLTGGYFLVSLLLFFYSYTQVDLNLTLTQMSVWQAIQKFFQNIGYFQRSLSLNIYLLILFGLYLLYGGLLIFLHKKLINKRQLWILIGMVTLVLVFSYPAFSYDMFNYMFTAKTVLVYHKNPYTVIPLQFIGIDPFLNFMRWTHLPSAYTPLWILLTLPAHILGFGNFLLTMFNIKLLVAAFYLLAIWTIGKILEQTHKQYALLGMGIFALNPLNLLETLVSGHNDIVMMAVALVAIYLALNQKKILAYFVLALSVGLKTMTLFLFPAAFLGWNRKYMLMLMSLGFILVLFQREPLPWYFIWLLPFVALLPEKNFVTIFATIFSLGLALRYASFIYLGHWNSPVPQFIFWTTLASVLVGGLVSLKLYFSTRNQI